MTDRVTLQVSVPTPLLPPSAQVEYFSQQNCEAVLGIPARKFLDLLRRPDAPDVRRIGKLRLVPRDAMIAFVDQVGAGSTSRAARDLDGPNTVLAEIGALPARLGSR